MKENKSKNELAEGRKEEMKESSEVLFDKNISNYEVNSSKNSLIKSESGSGKAHSETLEFERPSNQGLLKMVTAQARLNEKMIKKL